MKRSFILVTCLLCSSTLSAETFQSKYWSWSTDNSEFYYAATVNAVGHVLGQYCYFESGSCLYLLSFGTSGHEGSQYPAILNSDAGSAPVTLFCAYKLQGQHVLFVSGFDDIDRMVRTANRVGIAVPMEGDQFKVSRFDLVGSTQALDFMRAAAEGKLKRQLNNPSKPPPEEIL